MFQISENSKNERLVLCICFTYAYFYLYNVNGILIEKAFLKNNVIWNIFLFVQFPRLFDGCSFFFSGNFKSNPTKPEMLDIIRLGGGTILHREPKAETSHPLITESSPIVSKMIASKSVDAPTVAYHARPDTAQSHCTQYIIFDPETCPSHKRLSTPIMCTAPSTWLLDCISKFEIIEVRDF